MLKQLFIRDLFGIYTYDIDMNPQKDGCVKFITAPNGYGKTTILDIVDALYTENYDRLASIPYKMLRFTFSEGIILKVFQHKKVSEVELQSDEPGKISVSLTFVYYEEKDKKPIAKKTWSQNDNELDILPLHLYLTSHPIYYIRDQRLTKENNVYRIETDAKAFSGELRNAQAIIAQALSESLTTIKSPISYNDYQEKSSKLLPVLNTLKACNLTAGMELGEYNENQAVYLNAVVQTLESLQSNHKGILDKLSLFIKIIIGSKFANKQMQISPMYGFRFIADNEDHTILDAQSLSSGEKQIFILTFELLFMSDDSSIVLIDEPELSFHVAWQSIFLDNLLAISKLKALQCIVSTHSSIIFRNNWDLSTDLYAISHPKKYKFMR